MPETLYSEPPVHVIDFEGDRRCGVVEYGVVTLQGEAIRATDSRLCRPRAELRAQDTRLHGIRAEAAASAEPIEADWDFFANLRATGPLCAHCAGVEMGLLKQVWPYPPRSPDFSLTSETIRSGGDEQPPMPMIADWGPWLDTHALYVAAYPKMESHALGELVDACRLREMLTALAERHCPPDRRKPHCALYDALASALLLLALRETPPAVLPSTSLPALIRQSLPNQARRADAQQGRLF